MITLFVWLSLFVATVTVTAYVVHGFFVLTNHAHMKNLPEEVLDQIVNAMDLKATSKVIDLGCGTAKVLIAAYDSHPDAKFIGIENNPIVLMQAKMQIGRRNIYLKRSNLLTYDFLGATHIFLYLSSILMAEIEPKFHTEQLMGIRVITVQYPFPRRKPDQVLVLNGGSDIACKAYIYNF